MSANGVLRESAWSSLVVVLPVVITVLISAAVVPVGSYTSTDVYVPRHFFPLRCELPVGPEFVPQEHCTRVLGTTYSI